MDNTESPVSLRKDVQTARLIDDALRVQSDYGSIVATEHLMHLDIDPRIIMRVLTTRQVRAVATYA